MRFEQHNPATSPKATVSIAFIIINNEALLVAYM